MKQSKKSQQRYLAWLVWGLGCAFYFYETIVRTSPNVMNHELMHDFAISPAMVGFLSSFYFLSYAALQIPAGLLLDKLGPHRLLTTSTLVCALGAVIFGSTHSLGIASSARLLIGIGSAFAAIGTMKLAANWFKPERFAFLTGLMVSCGSLGGVFGEAPLALSVNHYGWRHTMIFLGILGLVLTFFIFQIVQDNPPVNVVTKDVQTHEPRTMSELMTDLLTIIQSSQIWLTAFYGGLMFAPTIVFCDLWGASFLMSKYPVITKATAAWMTSMVYIGWIVGAPIGGWISDRIRLRKPTMILGAIGAFLAMTSVIYVDMPYAATYAALFFFGVFSSGFLPAFSIIREISPQRSTATALGFMNMMNMIFIVVMQPLVGIILHYSVDVASQTARHAFTLSTYETAMCIVPASLTLAILFLPFIQETHCQISNNEPPNDR